MNELELIRNHFLGFHGCKDKMTTEDYNVHKGISDRSFSKKFQLHKHIVVDNAELKDGLLKVSYHRDIPEAEKPKQIKIKST
jgi:molecular chaperone IbpA